MNRDVALRKYNKKMDYTYSMGTFPTIELLKNQSDKVLKILIHSQLYENQQLELIQELCKKRNILIEHNDRAIEKIRDKEKCLVIGVFRKYKNQLEEVKNHIVLVNPSDMGNLGTIIRTSVGFGIHNVAIIAPGADIFNPKVIRASMGSVFQLHCSYFNEFNEYKTQYEDRALYPFMLKGATDLSKLTRDRNKPYSLIFGNESSGLEEEYSGVGTSVYINHNSTIDSLNLSMAVGIGLYEFTKLQSE